MPIDPVATRRFIEALSTHLEDHLALWKSSLADARREVETVLTTAGERIPAQAKSLFPEDIMEMLLEDALPAPAPPERIVERVVEKVVERVEVQVPTGSLDWSLVRGSISAVESARTQVDVLSRFLVEANAHASRVALLVLRNDRLTGWKAIGWDSTGGRDEGVKGIDVPAQDDPVASEVLRRERTVLADPPAEDSPIRRALGGAPPTRSLFVPMVIRDRIAGILVADELPGEEGRLSEAALETLTFVTGLAVDLLAARKKIPSPTLTPTGEPVLRWSPPAPPAPVEPVAAPAPAPPPPAVEPIIDPAATVQAIPVYGAPPAAAPAPAPAPAREPEPEPEPGPAPEPHAAPSPASTVAPASFDETDPSGKKRRGMSPAEALRALEESTGRQGRRDGVTPPIGFPPVSLPESLEALGVPVPTPMPEPAPTPAPAPVSSPAPAPEPPAESSGGGLRPAGDLTRAFGQLQAAPEPRFAPPQAPQYPQAPPPAPSFPSFQPAAPPPPPSFGLPPVPAPPPPVSRPATDPAAVAPGPTVQPPPGFVPRSARAADPQRQLEDARRFARLLVNEIKLYNERKVEEGRAAGNLYELLRDDIERSRQAYTERIPESVRSTTDFFNEELVRILAEGRPEALGPVG